MLPAIAAVLSVEMLREGGSLEARFQGIDGSRHCLHFPLLSARGPNNEFLRLGYAKPVVFQRVEYWEGTRRGWHSVHEVEISWPHATVLLRQMRNHIDSEMDARWLMAMEEAAASEGELPGGIEPVLQPAARRAGT
ncbi:hypothetical protein LRH25_17755 [Ideonella azotifigens]|nr:hypothetical protein [Ideonella azotifigens]MCD2342185.1 hypothetical protein [Ideonella azotifigens]